MSVTVIAVREFTHKGTTIHKGEAVTCEPLEAAVYAEQRCVTLDRSARATYRTRDLQAAAAEPVQTASVPEPVAVRRRRSRRT